MADDLVSDLEVVLHNDPALDLARMDLRKYLETRDPSLIVDVSGQRARRFKLRALDVAEVAAVADQSNQGTRAVLAVRHALASITPGLDGSGTAWHPAKEYPDSFGRLKPLMDVAEVDALFIRGQPRLGWAALVELALIVINRYESGNADGGGGLFSLPPQSELALARSARLRAEHALAMSTTQTTGQSSSA